MRSTAGQDFQIAQLFLPRRNRGIEFAENWFSRMHSNPNTTIVSQFYLARGLGKRLIVHNRAYFAAQIWAAYKSSVGINIEIGRILIHAKRTLFQHGEFGKMIRKDLPFGARWAQQYMVVAANPVISNANYASHLPSSLSTLRDLTKLPEAELLELIRLGKITPETQRKDVVALRQEVARRALIKNAPRIVPSQRLKLYLGDCLKVALKKISPASANCIIIDPPYDQSSLIPLIPKLGQAAIHCLKPGGLLLVLVGKAFLPQVYRAFDKIKGLKYFWEYTFVMKGAGLPIYGRRIRTSSKIILAYSKGLRTGKPDLENDTFFSPRPEKTFHEWQQALPPFIDIVETLTERGDMVLDLCMGTGTTGEAALILGRRFIGIDIDKMMVDTARSRLAQVQQRLKRNAGTSPRLP